MTFRFLPALLALSAAARLSAAERSIEKTFPAQPGCLVKLETYRGGVTVGPSGDARIHVRVRMTVGVDDPAEAKRLFDRVQLDIAPDKGGVSIRVSNLAETRISFAWSEAKRIGLEFMLLAPPATAIDVATQEGNVSFGNLTGKLAARTTNGNVVFRRIDGAVQASVKDGDIVLSRCSGDALLKASLGGIRAGTVLGRAELHALNGDIEIQHSMGGLAASTEMGDVTLGLSKGFAGEIRVTTNGGAISAVLDPDVACDIQASSKWGHVHSTLPIAVSAGGDGKKILTGRLNGGGPLVVLHADGGQVHLDPPRGFKTDALGHR